MLMMMRIMTITMLVRMLILNTNMMMIMMVLVMIMDCIIIIIIIIITIIILNCPETQSQRDVLMKRIDAIASGCGVYDQISFVDKFHILLGSVIPGLDINQMVEIWFTSAYFIGNMYKQRIKTRKGVG